ncbi:hypothetical protein [Aurantiacibacter hainanensis]|uniref:hypothetical protein n=1 Tax=Aurantiacibacter hainanensis TaxID=3076114 RepID=UPI0030C759B9
MTWIVLLLSSALALTGVLAFFVHWMFWSPGEDDAPIHEPSNRSIIVRMRKWFTRPTPKLEYRRDERGRFRKTWRG